MFKTKTTDFHGNFTNVKSSDNSTDTDPLDDYQPLV